MPKITKAIFKENNGTQNMPNKTENVRTRFLHRNIVLRVRAAMKHVMPKSKLYATKYKSKIITQPHLQYKIKSTKDEDHDVTIKDSNSTEHRIRYHRGTKRSIRPNLSLAGKYSQLNKTVYENEEQNVKKNLRISSRQSLFSTEHRRSKVLDHIHASLSNSSSTTNQTHGLPISSFGNKSTDAFSESAIHNKPNYYNANKYKIHGLSNPNFSNNQTYTEQMSTRLSSEHILDRNITDLDPKSSSITHQTTLYNVNKYKIHRPSVNKTDNLLSPSGNRHVVGTITDHNSSSTNYQNPNYNSDIYKPRYRPKVVSKLISNSTNNKDDPKGLSEDDNASSINPYKTNRQQMISILLANSSVSKSTPRITEDESHAHHNLKSSDERNLYSDSNTYKIHSIRKTTPVLIKSQQAIDGNETNVTHGSAAAKNDSYMNHENPYQMSNTYKTHRTQRIPHAHIPNDDQLTKPEGVVNNTTFGKLNNTLETNVHSDVSNVTYQTQPGESDMPNAEHMKDVYDRKLDKSLLRKDKFGFGDPFMRNGAEISKGKGDCVVPSRFLHHHHYNHHHNQKLLLQL